MSLAKQLWTATADSSITSGSGSTQVAIRDTLMLDALQKTPMTPLFPPDDSEALYFARSDVLNLLGTFSRHAFHLDDKSWPSVEHYYQAMKFDDPAYQEKIRVTDHPKKARKLGRTRFKKRRDDWKTIKTTVMTRGVYIKCRTHPEVAEALLATHEKFLVENSNYDYFWGCGRDRRGKNTYGVVLMNVREKLRQEGHSAAE